MTVSPKGAGYKALSADEGGGGKTWKEVLLARLPILAWLPSYDKSFFLPDVTGGLTLGTMCLAQTLAHATIATTNPIQGPHTALLPPVVYALLGTSKHGSVSSGAMVAMIIANVLQPFPEEHHTELASLLALVAGISQILMGMFDLASAVRFLSQPTLSGFITGGAVLIIVSQLRNFFGYTEFPHESSPFGKVWACLHMLDQANWANVGLCSTLILFLVCSKRLKKVAQKKSKLSNFWAMVGYLVQVKEIIVVVAGIVFVKVTQKGAVAAVPIVGHIPRGLPPCQLPWNFDATRKLLEGPSDVLHSFLFSGLVLAFSAFLTSYSSFKRQAIACDYALDARQELFALGASGVVGSFFGAFPPSGSLSRTGLAVQLGVQTQVCGIANALVVAAGLIFLAPLIEDLPKASLAAIVMVSAEGLMDFAMPLDLWRSSEGSFRIFRKDLIVWLVGFVCTILAGALYGIILSVLVAVAQVVADASTPHAVTLGAVPHLEGQWHDVKRWPEARTVPGVLVFEFRGPLVFASAEWFRDEVERMRLAEGRTGSIRYVILGMGAVPVIDYSAIAMLQSILTEWKKKGIHCIVAEANYSVLELLHEKLGDQLEQFEQGSQGVLSIDKAVALATGHATRSLLASKPVGTCEF